MIIVFGSLNIEMVMRVDKMPLPGDATLCPNYQLMVGGKGANQAVSAAKTGRSVKLFGCVGGDAFGVRMTTSLKESSVDLTHLIAYEGEATGCAVIYIDPQGEKMRTVASGVNSKLRDRDVPDSVLTKDTTLLLQMETSPEENWTLIRRAKSLGARIILNLSPAHPIPSDIFPLLNVLILNQCEASLLGLYSGLKVASPTVAVRHISATYGITCVLMMREEGALVCSPAGTWKIKAMDAQVVDTTATEDAFVGVLAASLDQGCDLSLALRRATAASALTCLTEGAQSSFPTEDSIQANLKKISPPRQVV